MEVSRLGVESEVQLIAYATDTAVQDLSCICNLHHSSWQRRIHNPLSKARDPTGALMIVVRFVTTEPQGEFLISFNLCILVLLLQVKNVAYSLKYTR